MIARQVRLVVGVGLAVIAFAFVMTLSERAPRLSGTNSVRVAEYIVVVPARGVVCQHGEYIPAGTAAIRLFTGVYEGLGSLRLAVDVNGTNVRTAQAAGFRNGWQSIPIERVRQSVAGATICVRNRQSHRLALAGLQSPPETAATQAGRAQRGRLGFEYLRGGRESWWQLAGTVARRAGDANASLFGPSVLWVAASLIVGAIALAVVLLVRDAR